MTFKNFESYIFDDYIVFDVNKYKNTVNNRLGAKETRRTPIDYDTCYIPQSDNMSTSYTDHTENFKILYLYIELPNIDTDSLQVSIPAKTTFISYERQLIIKYKKFNYKDGSLGEEKTYKIYIPDREYTNDEECCKLDYDKGVLSIVLKTPIKKPIEFKLSSTKFDVLGDK